MIGQQLQEVDQSSILGAAIVYARVKKKVGNRRINRLARVTLRAGSTSGNRDQRLAHDAAATVRCVFDTAGTIANEESLGKYVVGAVRRDGALQVSGSSSPAGGKPSRAREPALNGRIELARVRTSEAGRVAGTPAGGQEIRKRWVGNVSALLVARATKGAIGRVADLGAILVVRRRVPPHAIVSQSGRGLALKSRCGTVSVEEDAPKPINSPEVKMRAQGCVRRVGLRSASFHALNNTLQPIGNRVVRVK
jgi:hypothetical protein